MITIQDIYYINHLNQRIDLMESPYYLQTGDFFEYEWEYDSIDLGMGGRITKFKRGMKKKDLTLSVLAISKEAFYEALNNFHAYTEVDVLNLLPGKLYIGDQYMTCYLIQSSKKDWEKDEAFLDCTVSMISEYPFWKTENSNNLPIQSVISSDNKRYAGKYAQRYANGLTLKTLTNGHFAASDARIVMYGPITNPSVIIGNNTYSVNTVLNAGEYLTIDTAARTIIKTQGTGGQVNLFNYRNKSYDNFARVLPGVNSVSWAGDFAIDITIYEERSEPKWIL
ncbi:phage tail family protein [Parasporobacterium paucivorans]|uniref:Uncharacterized protein n=1 Tax=Parasporobacterium paucivorans DSM 15970 TaxID=1122934 RepID=A0A1M6B189_9FIRM|nr:hypothetical protein [Parasporobacterium paucivorans]SHI42471.1 hypothetical protein SAMN02745691_00233 [Parasporobacterium paucivorans DSM 15970]